MNISKYDFHDGYIIDMKHVNDKIEIFMESAEISNEELEDNIILSDHNTIKGKLHVQGIESIEVNGKSFSGKFVKTYEEGNIYSFSIKENTVILVVSWINHPPKMQEELDFFRIEVKSDKIFWENIPDLINPFW